MGKKIVESILGNILSILDSGQHNIGWSGSIVLVYYVDT